MMRKTGRLIHACPAQIAELAESFFITAALETQMINDVSRAVGWPSRYQTSPNDRTWPKPALGETYALRPQDRIREEIALSLASMASTSAKILA